MATKKKAPLSKTLPNRGPDLDTLSQYPEWEDGLTPHTRFKAGIIILWKLPGLGDSITSEDAVKQKKKKTLRSLLCNVGDSSLDYHRLRRS